MGNKAKIFWVILILMCIAVFRSTLVGNVFMAADVSSARSMSAKLSEEFMPLWNPFLFSGMPCAASLQYADPILYPPNWPAMLLSLIEPVPAAWNHAFHLIFAAFGFMLFVRRLRPDSGEWSRLFGAVSFAFSLQMLGYLANGHAGKIMTMCYVPWIFWSIECIRKDKDWRSTAFLALFVGLQMLRAHYQIVYYTWLTAIPYAAIAMLSEVPSERKRGYLRIAGAMAIGFLFSAVLSFPVIEYVGQSTRGGGVGIGYATGWSMPPLELLSSVMPGLYGYFNGEYRGGMQFSGFPPALGMLVVLFGLYGATKAIRSADWRFRALVGLLIGCLVLSLGKYTPIYNALYEFLPGFDKFRAPITFMLFSQFFISILAVLGLREAITRQWGKWADVIPGVSVGILMAIWGITGAYRLFPDAVRPDIGEGLLVISVTAVVALLIARHKSAVAAVAFVIVEILVIATPLPDPGNNKVLPQDGVGRWLQAHPGTYRVAALPPWHMENRWVADGVELVTGYHAAKPADYQKFIEEKTHNWTSVDLLSLVHLNVRYLISASKIPDIAVVDSSWAWYGNQRTKAYIHQIPSTSRATDEKFRSLKYERISFGSFRVNTELNGAHKDTVYVSERYFPGWHAKTEDGRKVEISRNGLMMKAIVPPSTSALGGPQWVEFNYTSNAFRIGFPLSCMSMGLIIGAIFKDNKWFSDRIRRIKKGNGSKLAKLLEYGKEENV